MFVIKDRRKIQEVLYDEQDSRESLKLGRREAEFGGSTSILLEPSSGGRLASCKSLSLYGNKLESLTHIDTLASNALSLTDINVSLPTTVGLTCAVCMCLVHVSVCEGRGVLPSKPAISKRCFIYRAERTVLPEHT